MSNILQAILNIAQNPVIELKMVYSGRNTINNIGEALEIYIQDAFANTITETNVHRRDQYLSETFSYLGNQNNPPDMILRQGDAIEVKKIQSKHSAIALNSSYPKDRLYYDDPKITDACRNCEPWQVKDIIYVVGITNDNFLKHLWFIYGNCYAANQQTYIRIGQTIKYGIEKIEDIEFSETKELGRINRVDPLGITKLRIRGMWHIDNPNHVFQNYYQVDDTKNFTLSCIMSNDKFNEQDSIDQKRIINHKEIMITDIKIKNPNNPAQLMPAKLIQLEVV